MARCVVPTCRMRCAWYLSDGGVWCVSCWKWRLAVVTSGRVPERTSSTTGRQYGDKRSTTGRSHPLTGCTTLIVPMYCTADLLLLHRSTKWVATGHRGVLNERERGGSRVRHAVVPVVPKGRDVRRSEAESLHKAQKERAYGTSLGGRLG